MAATRNQQIDRETVNAKDQLPRSVPVAALRRVPLVHHALRELARLSAKIEQHRQVLNDAGYEAPPLKAFLCHCDDEDSDGASGIAIAGVRTLERIYKPWQAEQSKHDAQNRQRRNKVEAMTQKAMIDTIALQPAHLALRLKKFAVDLEGV